jgi:hypothetical protein
MITRTDPVILDFDRGKACPCFDAAQEYSDLEKLVGRHLD